jgi:solute carrier family 45 protein 1/2/4
MINDQAIRSATLANLAFGVVALGMNIAFSVRDGINKPRSAFDEILQTQKKSAHTPHLGLVRAWSCAHVFFAFAMFCTFFTNSWISRAVLVASVGLSWSFTLCVPFAIIGYEIATSAMVDDGYRPNESQHAGTIMSLNNVAISAPQVVAALVCSGIFRLTHELGSADSIGWVLRGGACAALVAAFLTRKFEKSLREQHRSVDVLC